MVASHPLETAIDRELVKKCVDDMLREHGLNYFPDFLERKLYTNAITLVLRLLDSVMGHTKLVLFGHEIALEVRPAPIVID
jgi:hypothetical protein